MLDTTGGEGMSEVRDMGAQEGVAGEVDTASTKVAWLVIN